MDKRLEGIKTSIENLEARAVTSWNNSEHVLPKRQKEHDVKMGQIRKLQEDVATHKSELYGEISYTKSNHRYYEAHLMDAKERSKAVEAAKS